MEDDWYLEVCWKALAEIEQQDCNGITRSDYFPGVALQLFFIFNAVASHPNMHDYAKSITEPLLNLILLFCEKTRCFYHKIPSRFNANHIDKSQIKCACAAMQACAEFHYKLLTLSFRLQLIYIVVYSAQLCFPARWFASI